MATALDPGRLKFYRPGGKNIYFPETHTKRQIYLHHTTSHSDPTALIEEWQQSAVRSGCSMLIAGEPRRLHAKFTDGDIYSVFPSQYWALHLGIHMPGNDLPKYYKDREYTRYIEKHSIAVTLSSYGPLTLESGRFYSVYRNVVPENEVIEYVEGYRGSRFYHQYTDAQIESLRQALLFLTEQYEIPRIYQPDMWDITEHALKGDPGIFTHASVRTDVTDCHPQPSLIKMLMELGK
jgi:N-acetylmuramoyl-L-alanine amidase